MAKRTNSTCCLQGRHYDMLAKVLGQTMPEHHTSAAEYSTERALLVAAFVQWEKDCKAIVKMCVTDGNTLFNIDRFMTAVHREANSE